MALPQGDPSQQDFLSHKTTSSSGGESFSNSKYNIDTNISPTDNAARLNRTATGSSSGRSAPGSLGQTYIPNWSDIFPPPPDQPPPPSADSPPNSPRSIVRNRQQVTRTNKNLDMFCIDLDFYVLFSLSFILTKCKILGQILYMCLVNIH